MADEVEDPRAPGWKYDPTGRFLGRYWDGTDWTANVVSQDRSTSIDPIPVRPGQPARPAGTAQPAEGLPLWAKIGVAVAALWVLSLIFSPDEEKAQPAAPAPATSLSVPVGPGPPSMRVVGDTVRTGGFDITVHGFTDPQVPGRFPPGPGRHFLSVDVEVANRTTAPQRFSFLLGFHLLDQDGKEIDPMFGDVTPTAPDGDLAPGQSLRGRVLFEVPDGATDLRLRARAGLDHAGGLFLLR